MRQVFLTLMFLSFLTSPAAYAINKCEAIFSLMGDRQLIEESIAKQLAGKELNDNFWPGFSKSLMGEVGIRKMKEYFNGLAANAPGSDGNVYYRGMALNLNDINFIIHEGVKAEKSVSSKNQIFVATEFGDPIYYALSRTNNSRPFAVIILISKEAAKFDQAADPRYLKTVEDIPSKFIEKIYVFDPTRVGGQFPFNEVIFRRNPT